jgi:hypothetical protein
MLYRTIGTKKRVAERGERLRNRRGYDANLWLCSLHNLLYRIVKGATIITTARREVVDGLVFSRTPRKGLQVKKNNGFAAPLAKILTFLSGMIEQNYLRTMRSWCGIGYA